MSEIAVDTEISVEEMRAIATNITPMSREALDLDGLLTLWLRDQAAYLPEETLVVTMCLTDADRLTLVGAIHADHAVMTVMVYGPSGEPAIQRAVRDMDEAVQVLVESIKEL
jgi:hypothetical protein